MTIEGDYSLFAHLETVYLGCLARRSLVMRNVARSSTAARGKPIFYFPARHDHWLVQTGDGWSAHVAGAIGVSTDAQASWWGGRGIGTVPARADRGLRRRHRHGRDACSPSASTREMNITVLVDFDNDSVRTALEVAEALGTEAVGRAAGHLRGPRRPLAARRDGRLQARPASTRGWSRRCAPRSTSAGFADVRIVVCGGFTAERIREFEAAGVPVDAYGVGSSLIRGDNDFTADVVMVDGRPVREGRAAGTRRTRGSSESERPRDHPGTSLRASRSRRGLRNPRSRRITCPASGVTVGNEIRAGNLLARMLVGDRPHRRRRRRPRRRDRALPRRARDAARPPRDRGRPGRRGGAAGRRRLPRRAARAARPRHRGRASSWPGAAPAFTTSPTASNRSATR